MIIEAASSQADPIIYEAVKTELPQGFNGTGWGLIPATGPWEQVFIARLSESNTEPYQSAYYLFNDGYDVSDDATAIPFTALSLFSETEFVGGLGGDVADIEVTFDIITYKLNESYADGLNSGNVGAVSKTELSRISKQQKADRVASNGGQARFLQSMETYVDGIGGSYGILVEFTNFVFTPNKNYGMTFQIRTNNGTITFPYGSWTQPV